MFYVFNVAQWFDEVIANCNERNLDPEDSLFLLMIFSSLDFDFVEFFRKRKGQISHYSGENFHVFTPMVYEGDVVPDGEWRYIRDDFNRKGIPVSNKPFALFFKLNKRKNGFGYEPDFLTGHECRNFEKFSIIIRDIIDIGIKFRHDSDRIQREFSLLFGAPNLIKNIKPSSKEFGWPIDNKLRSPRFFVSYSHADAKFVSNLYNELHAHNVDLWIDRNELQPGMIITDVIDSALRSADGIMTILSKNSLTSRWLQFEGSAFYVNNKNKPIIPIILDSEAKNQVSGIPFLKDRLYIDFSVSETRAAAMEQLAKAIKNAREQFGKAESDSR